LKISGAALDFAAGEATPKQSYNLRVGNASVALAFERQARTVGIDILRRAGEIEIVALR
jgi:hypothetical protein